LVRLHKATGLLHGIDYRPNHFPITIVHEGTGCIVMLTGDPNSGSETSLPIDARELEHRHLVIFDGLLLPNAFPRGSRLVTSIPIALRTNAANIYRALHASEVNLPYHFEMPNDYNRRRYVWVDAQRHFMLVSSGTYLACTFDDHLMPLYVQITYCRGEGALVRRLN